MTGCVEGDARFDRASTRTPSRSGSSTASPRAAQMPSWSILIVLFIGTQLVAGLVTMASVERNQRILMFGLPLHIRALHHHLPGGPGRLLDLDQRLDARPAVRRPAPDPAAREGEAGGRRGREGREAATAAAAQEEEEALRMAEEESAPEDLPEEPIERVRAIVERVVAEPRRRGRGRGRGERLDDHRPHRGRGPRPADRPPRPDDRRHPAHRLPRRVPRRQGPQARRGRRRRLPRAPARAARAPGRPGRRPRAQARPPHGPRGR